ncbi:MAG: hypothetical protein GXX85_11300 [Ignavibacteria bacterium]|nr:hypothetical protein [Ignavibacteria bacterium]
MKYLKIVVVSYALVFFPQYTFAGRYYDSETGRWLQVDPMADKYPGWSPYNYCADNPLKNVDPNGMWYVYAGVDEEQKKFAYIKLVWEKGDNLNTLSERTGYSVDELKGMYDENTLAALEAGEQTDLSSFGDKFEGILEALNANMDPSILEKGNCFGMSLSYSKDGKVDFGSLIGDPRIADNKLQTDFTQTDKPRFGDVIRYGTGTKAGEAAHYGVFLLRNGQDIQTFNKLGYSSNSTFTLQWQSDLLSLYGKYYGSPVGIGGGSPYYRKK